MKLLRPRRRIRAFTLVEILTVITIIAILAAIGIGGFSVAIEKSRGRKTLSMLAALKNNMEGYKNDAGEFPSPTNQDVTTEVKGKPFKSGGAIMLYQIMSGDGDDGIFGGAKPSTGVPGSAAKIYWDEVVPPTKQETTDKKDKPMVGGGIDTGFFLIDGWRKPFQYTKAVKNRNKQTVNVDELHSDGDYEIFSYGPLKEALDDPEAQKEWITSWGSN